MSLKTPDAIRTLQRKLYDKAKTEPGYRFYILYDKVWRADILRHAYLLARANDGAPGVDGVTFEQIETMGLENWLSQLGEELRAKTYRCQAVRRLAIGQNAARVRRSRGCWSCFGRATPTWSMPI